MTIFAIQPSPSEHCLYNSMIRFPLAPRMQFYELFAKGFAAVVFNLSTTALSKHWSLQAVRAAQDKQVEQIDLRQAAALQSMFTNTFFVLKSAICSHKEHQINANFSIQTTFRLRPHCDSSTNTYCTCDTCDR